MIIPAKTRIIRTICMTIQLVCTAVMLFGRSVQRFAHKPPPCSRMIEPQHYPTE